MKVSEILYKSFLWRGVQFLLSFFINAFLAHYLGAAITGEFFSLIYIFASIAFILSIGLDVSFVYFVSRKLISFQKIVSILGLLVLTVIPLSWLILKIMSYSNNVEYFSSTEFIYYGLSFITGNILFTLVTAVLTGINKYHLSLIVLVAGAFLNVLVILLFVSFNFNWQYYFAFNFLLALIQAITIALILFRNKNHPFLKVLKDIPTKFLFKYALNKFTIAVLFLVSVRWSIYLLPFSSLDKMLNGNYVQMFKLNEYMATVASFIYLPLIAINASNKKSQNVSIVSFFIRAIHTILIIYALFILLTKHHFFTLLFGDTYSEMADLFFIMFPGLVAICASPFITGFFFSQKKFKYNFISATISFIISVGLYFPLLNLYGIKGVAIGWSIAMLASYSYDIYVMQKYYDLKMRKIIFVNSYDLDYFITNIKSFVNKKR